MYFSVTKLILTSNSKAGITVTVPCVAAQGCSSLFPVGIQGCKRVSEFMVLCTLWLCLCRATHCALSLSGLTDEPRHRRWLLSIGGWFGWRWGNAIYNWTKSDSVQKAQRIESKVGLCVKRLFLYIVCLLLIIWVFLLSFKSDLKPSEDPDEIFKAIKEGMVMSFFNLSKPVQTRLSLILPDVRV